MPPGLTAHHMPPVSQHSLTPHAPLSHCTPHAPSLTAHHMPGCLTAHCTPRGFIFHSSICLLQVSTAVGFMALPEYYSNSCLPPSTHPEYCSNSCLPPSTHPEYCSNSCLPPSTHPEYCSNSCLPPSTHPVPSLTELDTAHAAPVQTVPRSGPCTLRVRGSAPPPPPPPR